MQNIQAVFVSCSKVKWRELGTTVTHHPFAVQRLVQKVWEIADVLANFKFDVWKHFGVSVSRNEKNSQTARK